MTDTPPPADPPPPREPGSDARVAAIHLRDYYVALIGEGFTPDQAMRVVLQMIATAATVQRR